MPLIDHIQDMPWAMRQAKLDEITAFLTSRINGEPIEKAFQAAGKSGGKGGAGYEILDGVAVIPIMGTISKRMNMLSEFSGGTSSELIRKDLEAALRDRSVSAIMLDIESPGGSVDGTAALSDFIFQSRGQKPIIAFANGMMASAAYWIGSAADAIIATEDAMVGSIGVAMTHVDRSQSDKQEGIVRTEIFAGKYKRIATGNQPLSEDGKAYLQGMVDHFYGMFIDAVARNRGVSVEAALKMADGKEFIGKQALEAGLVDLIGTRETALGKAKERGSNNVDIKTLQEKHADLFAQVKAMGAEEATKAAIEAGIKQERDRVTEIIGADGDPIVTAKCLVEGIDVKTSVQMLLKAEKEGKAAKLEGMKKSAPQPVGQETPATRTETYETKLEALVKEGKTRAEATKIIVAEFPALHEDYLKRTNQ